MKHHSFAIKIIGLGGIGGCLLEPLCRLINYGSGAYSFGEVEFVLIDGGCYEDRDKDRQVFRVPGNRAAIAARSIKRKFSNLQVKVHRVYVDQDNIEGLIQDGDVVFLCVDNNMTRRLVTRYCEERLTTVAAFSSRIDSTGAIVQVFIRENGRNVTMPLDNNSHPQIKYPTDKHPSECAVDDEKKAPTPHFLITNNMAAALMLNAFHGWLIGFFSASNPIRYYEVLFALTFNSVHPVLQSERLEVKQVIPASTRKPTR